MKKKTPKRIIGILAIIGFISIIPGGNFMPQPVKQNSDLMAQTKKTPRVRKFALNFKDVEIAEFINVMSQLIGKNIIIADNVKGKITISSAKEVPISEAYNVMKSILEIKGLAVVESENLIKIIPINDAVKKNAEVILDDKTSVKSLEEDKTITYLLEINDADATEISAALKQVASKTTSIIVYQTLNTIIFSGNSTEINGLVKIARTLDRPLEEGEDKDSVSRGNIHVVHLENANAEDLAAVLSRIPFSETAKIDRLPLPRLRRQQHGHHAKRHG